MSLLTLDPDFKCAFDGPKKAQDLFSKVFELMEVENGYLFGSAVEGRNTENSDLDILLVVPDGTDLKK